MIFFLHKKHLRRPATSLQLHCRLLLPASITLIKPDAFLARRVVALLLAYHYDTNCILAEPIPNRKANSIVAGHKQIVKRLRRGRWCRMFFCYARQ